MPPTPLTLAIAIAPAPAVVPVVPAAPTTDAVAAVAATVPAAAATLPTSRPMDELQADIIHQVGVAIEWTGLSDTVVRTPWWAWVCAAFCIFVGLLVGRVAYAFLRRTGQRRAERVKLLLAVIYNSLAGPISLLIFMIGLGLGLSLLTISPQLRAFIIRFFQLMNVIFIGWLLYNFVDIVALTLARWSRGRQGNLSIMLVPLARKTLRVLLITVLLLFAAENVFGQDVKALLTGLGIAGLAVSLAAQDTIRNLFGSVMIFADQPFAIGDKVKVLDHEGKVEDIGFRSTRIRTADGFVATIPNGNIASAAVLNLSRRHSIRRTLDVTLAADGPPEQMEAALRLLREVVADPAVAARFDPARPPSVTFDEPALRRARVIYWFGSSDVAAYAAHAEQLNLKVVEAFYKAGIAFK